MDVLMPQLGETVAEGKISKWFVAAGDAVKPGDNLFEIETDKVSMEVPAISAGVISAINVAAGETVPVGAVVAIIAGKGETAAGPTPLIHTKAGIQKAKELGPRLRGDERIQAGSQPRPTFQMEPFREVRSPERNYGPARLPGGAVTTPLARRLAGEAGIDLTNVKGSGPRGRIVARDVEAARATSAALAPTQAQAAANVILTADVEITQAHALCRDVPAIELTDIVIKAWAAALQRVTPSEKSDIALIGRVRAVVRDAAGKPLTAIAKARGNPAETNDSGASTAISIATVAGIMSVTDVLRPPQTTMLAAGAARRAPVETADGAVKFVSVMTVTLSCDPRVVDAARGAELLGAFKRFVEQPVTMIV